MKKNQQFKTLILCLFAFACIGTVNAQTPIYQLPNGGFEEWYRETSNAGSIVPVNFNSFYSAKTNILTSFGVAKRCDSSRLVRSGATGTFCLYLYSTATAGVRANGNVTTGRMNMGAAQALNVDNYNWTDYTTSPPKHYQEITGTPDYLRFWVKYKPGKNGTINTTDKGRIRVYIHGTGECRDAPVYPSGKEEEDYYYGKAMKEFYKEDGEWHSYEVPFVYDGRNVQKNTNGNRYVLVSMTTNSPGGGEDNQDEVWFDDVELIYSAWLSDLKINGQTIDGFQNRLLTYGGPTLSGQPPYAFPYAPSAFTYTPEAADILSVVITNVNGPNGDADGGYTSILVTAEDGVTQVEYRIYYFVYLSGNNNVNAMSYTMDEITPIPVPGFTSAVTNYSINLNDPEEVRVPQIVAESIVLADPTANVQNIIQPTGVNSTGRVIVQAENYSTKSYNLKFTKTVSTNSKLNWIKVANVDLPNFDPNVLEYTYEISTCTTTIPEVTYGKASVWASVNYSQASSTNKTAIITVTAEDNTTVTTYKINFVFTNNNVAFTNIRYGTSSTNQITYSAGQTVYISQYSFTTAPTLLALTKSCAQAVSVKSPLSSNVYSPDTNYFAVTAQNGITTETYKVVIKNTNCFVATGNNNGFRYNYNGLVNQNTNINITTTNNNNQNTVITSVVTLPAGPNVPPELVVYGLAASVAPPTYTIVQPTHRNDTATVTLTAHDGVTQKIYRVPFKETLSADASLSDIICDGVSIPSFTSNVLEYTVWLSAGATQVPEITGIPSFQWLPAGNIVVTPATDLLGTTTITVTSENGLVTRTYSVNFDVEPVDNAYLSVITYDGNVVQGFSPTNFNYTVEISYSNTCPAVVGIPMAAGAHVFYNTSGTPPCSAEILVFSENLLGMKVYTVTFVMIKNTNAKLADIKVNGVSLDDFTPQTFEYDVELPYTEMNAPVVTATTAYPNAHAVITQIDTIMGTVTINVTAEDVNFTEEYTVNITRAFSPVVAIATIYYDYNNASYTYEIVNDDTEFTIMLPMETEGEPVITNILLADNRADAEIVEQPDGTNDLTGTVLVTAEDQTEETYSVIFERELSPSTLLTGIFYNGNLVPGFNPNVTSYHILLDYNTTPAQTPVVTATVAWSHTNVNITQATPQPFGQATVAVTSEDGQHNKNYSVIFDRDGDAHLIGLSYNLAGEIIPVPGFDPSTLVYNIELDYATTAVPSLEYILEDNRCTVQLTGQSTPTGTSKLKIITWNQGDSLTYTVNFTVLISTDPVLIDLLVDGETIEGFDPEKLDYKVDYPFGKVDLPVVTAVAKYADATVVTTQIGSFPGTATAAVTAGDLTSARTYTIDFSVDQGDNTYLLDLLIDGIHWYKFDKDVYFYEYPTSFGVPELPEVIGIPEDERSTVTYTPEYPDYQLGDTVKVIVTAINGDVAIYYVYFSEPKNVNAHASMIYVDWEPIEDFARYIYEYDYELPANYTGDPAIVAIPEDPNATVGKPITTFLPPVWKIDITITAENGVDELTYTINFTKNNSVITYTDEVKINVYPNPTSEVIHFEVNEYDQASSLEIYSIEGKKVSSHTLQSGNNPLNVAHLQKGIYIYKIFSDQTMLGVGKFIKN